MISHIDNYGPNPNKLNDLIVYLADNIQNLKNINICVSKLNVTKEVMTKVLGEDIYKQFMKYRTISLNHQIKLHLLLPNNINYTTEVSASIGLYISFKDYEKDILNNYKLDNQYKIYVPWDDSNLNSYNENYPQSKLINIERKQNDK
ncbi:hypothetical protein HOO31_04760 [Aliarcobacter cryaerophilus]|uniref:hypothetical protein n=1 Tax=Aliarcobacter cryaerophilus TaxID=28198 RepID=UPI00164B0593|nr:hypothetical protein [Aliarcobacter cryaerophilus]QNK85921.1 hypothetical protein HOO31_04760 [Aliarcobacter cryaerophilus]